MRRLCLYLPLFAFCMFPGQNYICAQGWSSHYERNMLHGEERLNRYDYKEAYTAFAEAQKLALTAEADEEIIKSSIKLASVSFELGQIDAGLNIVSMLDSLYLKETSLQNKAKIKSLLALGNSYQGKYEASREYNLTALDFALSSNDSVLISFTYRDLSYAYVFLGDYQQALSNAKLALTYSTKKDLETIAYANSAVSLSYDYLGEPQLKELFLLEALQVAEETNNLSLLARMNRSAGALYNSKNDYQQALEYYKRGLEISEKLKIKSRIAGYYKIIGITYSNMEEAERSLNYLNRALALFEELGNATQSYDIKLSIAQIFEAQGELETSEELMLEALEYFLKTNNDYLSGRALINLADLKMKQNEYEQALQYLENALEIGEDPNMFWVQRRAFQRYLVIDDRYYTPEKKFTLARDFYLSAKNMNVDRLLWATVQFAKAHHAVNSDSSFYYAEEALNLIEKKRISISGGTLKAGLFADYASFYNEVGSWYAAKNQYSKAFDLIESSKARALLDQLAEAHADESLNLPEETQIALLQLQKKIDQLYREREATQLKQERQNLTDAISDAELEYDVRLEQIRDAHPGWSSFIYPNTLSLEEVQELCDSKTAIIEFAFTDTKLLIFFVSEKETYVAEQNLQGKTKEKITKKINVFRDAIIQKADIQELSAHSDSLYAVLIKPVEQKIKDFSNIVIIPDGPLTLLPFDAIIHKNKFLVEDFAIKYLPSVSVFNLIESPHRETSRPFLAFAGSGFEAASGLSEIRTQQNFASLPYTIIEVDSVAVKFDTPRTLKNEEVTEAALKSLSLDNYKYIHFATHGDINEATPSQSGLILSKKKDTETLFGEDGYLNASEISDLRLNADMVVLSACNTGTGRVIDGEGLLGLQRSFLAAGASSVVASLWSIYDRSTPVFMQFFYSKLIEYEQKETGLFQQFLRWANLDKPELVDYKSIALREAKLEMLHHPYYNHPVHWASFVMTGK